MPERLLRAFAPVVAGSRLFRFVFLDVLAVLDIPNVADQKPVVTSETTVLLGYGLTGIVFRSSTVYAGHNVRVVLRPAVDANARAGRCPRRDENKEPWFVLKDVCDVLNVDTRDVNRRLEESDVDTTHIRSETAGQNRSMLIVNESGLYDVIFQSRTVGRYRPTRTSISDAWSSRKRRGFVAG